MRAESEEYLTRGRVRKGLARNFAGYSIMPDFKSKSPQMTQIFADGNGKEIGIIGDARRARKHVLIASICGHLRNLRTSFGVLKGVPIDDMVV